MPLVVWCGVGGVSTLGHQVGVRPLEASSWAPPSPSSSSFPLGNSFLNYILEIVVSSLIRCWKYYSVFPGVFGFCTALAFGRFKFLQGWRA